MVEQKHIHVIGICGVATSALAIAFHKKGWKVTGSDKGFFPPVSMELEKSGIEFYAGWHPEKMTMDGLPDFVVIGTASGTGNPETAFAKEKGIPMYSFAEAIGKFFVREKSIIVCGTWGKTSSSALLSHILIQSGFDPSYMFGGVSLSHESAARLSDSKWSVFEGDEYKSSPIDPKPKFSYYKPTHLLLTAVSWDHADLYPTEKDYFHVFKKLTASIPAEGLIVANTDNEGVQRVLNGNSNARVVTYGKRSGLDYSYENVKQSKNGIAFTINRAGKSYKIRSPMIGAFQAENMTGCFAMAREIGVPPEAIISAISSFKGLKRRLERRLDGDITIFDDIAHSPEKAASVLKELRSIYTGKIVAIFEPNSGGRNVDASSKYDYAFKDASTVIIPRLTKLKVADNETNKPIEGDELTNIISKTHKDAHYIEDDAELIEYVISQIKKGDVIVFLGSHGFRGMIEETVKRLER